MELSEGCGQRGKGNGKPGPGWGPAGGAFAEIGAWAHQMWVDEPTSLTLLGVGAER